MLLFFPFIVLPYQENNYFAATVISPPSQVARAAKILRDIVL